MDNKFFTADEIVNLADFSEEQHVIMTEINMDDRTDIDVMIECNDFTY